MTTLTHATLDLFLYDLREGLGQSQAEISANRNRFKQKLPNIDSESFEQRDSLDSETEYLELLAERTIDFSSKTSQGYYFPVRLNDAYGLLIECELRQAQSIEQIGWLADLQQTVLNKLNGQTADLGETWLFSAQLPSLSNVSELAQRCAVTLLNNDNIQIKCQFLEGTLFECWTRHQQHVIIIFYQQETTEAKIADLYPDFMHLLVYRHKIMWAYQESRKLKQILKSEAVKTESYRDELNSYMQQRFHADKFQQTLQGTWKVLSKYDMGLNDLSYRIRIIETNRHNYAKRLNTLEDKIKQELHCFKYFSTKTQDKYLLQVKTDYANLSPELRSLENMIEYIRASVAIEEEKRDRSFQNTIATWGIGLAAGAIVASISGLFPNIPEEINSWATAGFSIGISLLVAIIAGLATKIWLWWRENST